MFGDTAGEPGRVRIKICGICHSGDAHAAAELGADAIGLNCYRGSRRYLNLFAAADWISALPPTLRTIAVLVNPTFEEAIAIAELPFISGLQLHGQESPDFCRRLAARGIELAKALPVAHETSLRELPSFSTSMIVLDSASAGKFGGSGKTFPWHIARQFIAEHADYKVVLAGGLIPENVADAIRATRPFAVDVTSGVESSNGRKDPALLRAFIEAARSVA